MRAGDYYFVLGVLPSADFVVIRAAYLALVNLYHPEKWVGDKAEADNRMAEINAAYRILSDRELREKFDEDRRLAGHAEYQSVVLDEYGRAFCDALDEEEDRWRLAVEILPDLAGIRSSLAQISIFLEFYFVTLLLESKQFSKRNQIAADLERSFLECYFGKSPDVVAYAKEAILEGNRDAVLMLNRLVSVMGVESVSDLIVQRVEKEFGVREGCMRRQAFERYSKAILEVGDYEAALGFTKLLGYRVFEISTGFLWLRSGVVVVSEEGVQMEFDSQLSFVRWVQSDLCK